MTASLFINFKKITLKSNSSYCKTQDEYVIFDFDHAKIDLNFEEVSTIYEDYTFLDLDLIDKPSIIMHKKYIHKITINKDLENNLDFEPTKSINLDIGDDYRP